MTKYFRKVIADSNNFGELLTEADWHAPTSLTTKTTETIVISRKYIGQHYNYETVDTNLYHL